MKVLITGAAGRVGRALVRLAPSHIDLRAVSHGELDVTDMDAVAAFMRQETPHAIINAAAHLHADNAEREPSVARAINTDGARHLALAARDIGARLVQLSTAYVFDGTSPVPYRPDSPTNPLSVYGTTKLEGEKAALGALPGNSTILRTSWLYSREGPDFLHTVLRTLKLTGSVEAVADQIGTPTYVDTFARIAWKLTLERALIGIFHWTDSGVASWYDFAVAVAEEAAALGLLSSDVTVIPTTTRLREDCARRPRCSLLESTLFAEESVKQTHWRVRLRTALADVKSSYRINPAPHSDVGAAPLIPRLRTRE